MNMKKSSYSTLFVAILFAIGGFACGYIMDAAHKADRIYDLKQPKIIYRDTCCQCAPKSK